jgi:hypothetical protein
MPRDIKELRGMVSQGWALPLPTALEMEIGIALIKTLEKEKV